MIIRFTPQRRDHELSLFRHGETLIINGETLDLQGLQIGTRLPMSAVSCEWLASDIARDADGRTTFTLILPLAAGLPEGMGCPDPIRVDADGEIILPLAAPTMEEPA